MSDDDDKMREDVRKAVEASGRTILTSEDLDKIFATVPNVVTQTIKISKPDHDEGRRVAVCKDQDGNEHRVDLTTH